MQGATDLVTQCDISEDLILQQDHCENLKSCIKCLSYFIKFFIGLVQYMYRQLRWIKNKTYVS